MLLYCSDAGCGGGSYSICRAMCKYMLCYIMAALSYRLRAEAPVTMRAEGESVSAMLIPPSLLWRRDMLLFFMPPILPIEIARHRSHFTLLLRPRLPNTYTAV